VKRLARRKKRAFARAKKRNTEEAWNKYHQLKKLQQQTCRNAYQRYVADIADGNSQKLGRFVKNSRAEQAGIPTLKNNTGKHTEPRAKADILNEQFASVFSKEEGNITPKVGSTPYPPMPPITITPNGVTKLLRNLKTNKAGGPDGITPRFLKIVADEITPALTLLYQACVKQGKVPQEWKTAHVCPLFKKGDRLCAANYRPISLTCILCKVCEHIVHSSIINHLESHGILSDANHGFRKRRSTVSQLTITVNDLASIIDKKGQADLVLLDFSKAFDKVAHNRLLAKLDYYGVRNSTLGWIASFLQGRTQEVVLEGAHSRTLPVDSGVPQGTVMGPLLFLVYINDITEGITSSIRLFADDCVVYRTINSTDDARALQADLDLLQEWERKWLMHFNPDKCEVIQITRKTKPINTTYYIHDQPLATVDSAKYLGVNIHKKLSWDTHISYTVKKARSTIGFLNRNLRGCSQQIKDRLYNTYARPVLEYACSVWDPHTQKNITSLEKAQRSAARFVSGNYYDYKPGAMTSIYKNLGWSPLAERRKCIKLQTLHSIIHGGLDVPIPPCYTKSNSRTRGHNQRYFIPAINTEVLKSSFFPTALSLWNKLPQEVVDCTSQETFKSALTSASL
jgi:hypothetical protein